MNTRAGRYIKQLAGYSAFIPAPLPPDPPVRIDSRVTAALSRADMALGRLEGSILTLPNPDLFVLMYVRKEAVLSSQIEGTQSSLHDLLAVEADMIPGQEVTDVDEVINYIAAMNHGLARLKELPVSIRLIREIHERLLAGVRGNHLTPGELRKSQNWIGPAGCSLADATFVPPPPNEVMAHLGELEKFLHTPSDLPLLIRIGMAHAQFEVIHPFLDGNGRVGRLLITLLLCEQQALSQPVLYLSYFFKRHRQEYYDRLQAIRDGNWEGWIEFFLRGVAETSDQAAVTARNILALRETHRLAITEKLGRAAGNGHRVLDMLYSHPIVSVAGVQERTGTTFPAANQLVSRLEQLGILKEFTGNRRNRRYRYESYIQLFDVARNYEP